MRTGSQDEAKEDIRSNEESVEARESRQEMGVCASVTLKRGVVCLG